MSGRWRVLSNFNKTYSVVATSYAGRSGEPIFIHFGFPGCKENKNTSYIAKRDTGEYEIQYNRNKARGKKKRNADSFTLITGELEIATIDKWIAYFPHSAIKATNDTMNGRTGRFFRSLKLNKNNELISTVMPIGKGPCRDVAFHIATFLELPHPEDYKGQSWRGTAASIAADMGLEDSEIQNITGHKSVAALKVYKANSEPQKQKVANAVSLKPTFGFSFAPRNNENQNPKKRNIAACAGKRNI